MKTEVMNLWNTVPGLCEEIPKITAYIPDEKKSSCAVVILPGGAYVMRAEHEGKGYAEFFGKNGITSFVVDYRVHPHEFPLPLLDARRGVKFVRFFSEKYGVDKDKIIIMGSSAGGHLAALTSTCFDEFDCSSCDDIDRESFVPNAQVLCYPVINLLGNGVAHVGSVENLLGSRRASMSEKLSPDLIVSAQTPPAFVWHTMEDNTVNVVNSLDYIKALKKFGIRAELHVFPDGYHGLGLADKSDDSVSVHVSKWPQLLLDWIKYMNF